MNLSDILKDSNYKLTQFRSEQIEKLDQGIVIKEIKNKKIPFLNCIARKKEMRLTPEEAVRQLYALILRDDFGYSIDRMEFEYVVSFGREKKRADIVIFDKDRTS